MSKRNKHKMSENFESEKEQDKDILNSTDNESQPAQETNAQDGQEAPQEAQEETIESKLANSKPRLQTLRTVCCVRWPSLTTTASAP